MTVYRNEIESRPPPKRRRSIRLTTPGIPFYRDVRILRLITQVVFAVAFIGSLVLLWLSLTSNLAKSNIALDFSVYTRRFGAGITEGIDFTSTWGWVGNINLLESPGLLILWIIIWLLFTAYITRWLYQGTAANRAAALALLAFSIVSLPGLALGNAVLSLIWLALSALLAFLLYYFTSEENSPRLALLLGGLMLASLVVHPALFSAIDDALVPYLSPTTNTRAIITGIINTLKVVFLSVIASTVLGILVGIGLLSRNFLIRNVSSVYVEIFRNTPLLIQLLFIHTASLLLLPEVTSSITSPDSTPRVNILLVASGILGLILGLFLWNRALSQQVSALNNRRQWNTSVIGGIVSFVAFLLLVVLLSGGLFLLGLLIFGRGRVNFYEVFYVVNVRGYAVPKLIPNNDIIFELGPLVVTRFGIFLFAVIVALLLGYFLRRWRLQLQEMQGIPARTWTFVLPTVIALTLLGWWLAGGYPLSRGPFHVQYPEAGRFNIEGGWQITTFFVSLFLGLTLYTAAFIADIVRAGIQAVPHGQIEAARSLGLGNSQVLGMVVLPQALRLIIPPLGNQYVNLGKNSSLGLAVGFADAYRVVGLANNESGQAVPFFVGLMVMYLALSLTFSVMTNMLNTLTEVRSR